METTHTELESKAIELSTDAFNAFCEDISGMFNVDMKCAAKEVSTETTESLKKKFRKLSAINIVKSDGVMNGSFHLIFDQGGLFTLSGVIVMLPENRILEEIKRGTIRDVESMNDAIRETGNLCVGSWDRIFREEFQGHEHFVQNGTFIGNTFDKPEESIGLNQNESLSFVLFEMTVGSYPVFNCGVIFPKSIFELKPESVEDKKENKVEDTKIEPNPIDEEPEDSVKTKTEKNKIENGKIELNPVDEKPEDSVTTRTEENKVEEISPKTGGRKKTKAKIKSVAIDHDTPDESTISESIEKITKSHAVLPGQNDNISLSISAQEIMDTNVTWCSPDESVEQAIEKMQQFDTGYLMIGNNDVLEGIVSRSVITGALSPYLRTIFSKWRRPLDDATMNIRIKWIMSRPVHTVKTETPVIKIMENMSRLGVRCLPVMNQKGKIEGIITVFDIFKALNTNMDITTEGKTLQVPLLI